MLPWRRVSGSLRRFNDLFKQQYRMPPTALRKQLPGKKETPFNTTLTLGYRPPYQWEQLLDFLGQRAIPGVEVVRNNTYMRTVHYVSAEQKMIRGWLRVEHRPQKNALTVTVSSDLLSALPHLLARVRKLFDLYCCPDAVHETLSVLNALKPGLCVPGIRLPGCFEPFEMTVRAILGQQITVKAAGTLAGRIAQQFGYAGGNRHRGFDAYFSVRSQYHFPGRRNFGSPWPPRCHTSQSKHHFRAGSKNRQHGN